MSNELVDFVTEMPLRPRVSLGSLLTRPNYFVCAGSILLALAFCVRGYAITIMDRTAGTNLIGGGDFLMQIASFRPAMLAAAATALAVTWRRRNTPFFTIAMGVFCFLAMMTVMIGGFHALEATRWNSDWVRLQLNKKEYDQDIAKAYDKNGLAFRVWSWGHDGPDDASGKFYYLVYDNTDQIMSPLKSRSADWHVRAGGWSGMQAEEDDSVSTTITLLDPHFYFVTLTQ